MSSKALGRMDVRWPRILSFCIICGTNAVCPSFNINSPPTRTILCPGDIITYTCTLSSGFNTITTWWTGSGFHCPAYGVSPANTISLSQPAGGPLNTVPVSCGNLSAVMTNISETCYTSVLTIPTPQYFNGTTVVCRDGTTGTLIGNDTLNIQLASPPNPPTITSLISTYSDQLTVTWTSVPTATSYNVSINDSVNTLVPIPSSGPLQYTFTGLANNTVHTVSVVAINCAGSSSLAIETKKTAQPATPSTSTSTPSASSSLSTNVNGSLSQTKAAIVIGVGVVGVVTLAGLVLVVMVVIIACRKKSTRQLCFDSVRAVSKTKSVTVMSLAGTKNTIGEPNQSSRDEEKVDGNTIVEVGHPPMLNFIALNRRVLDSF